jgi:hypothetical protein
MLGNTARGASSPAKPAWLFLGIFEFWELKSQRMLRGRSRARVVSRTCVSRPCVCFVAIV